MTDKINCTLAEFHSMPDSQLAEVIRKSIETYSEVIADNNYEGTFLHSTVFEDAVITIAIVAK